jgi:hypothetical protein
MRLRLRLEDSNTGSSKGEFRERPVKKTPVVEQRRLQRESRDEDSSRGSSKGDSREGQVTTPVEGRVKETPGSVK